MSKNVIQQVKSGLILIKGHIFLIVSNVILSKELLYLHLSYSSIIILIPFLIIFISIYALFLYVNMNVTLLM